MTNYSLKINLLKVVGAFLTNIKGRTTTKRCIVIPIDDGGLFLGQKGLYLDVTAIEMQSPQYNETHCLKQSLPKEKHDQMTDEERKQLPILGGMRAIERKQEQMTIATTYDVSLMEDGYGDVPF